MANMDVTGFFRAGFLLRAGRVVSISWVLTACATSGGSDDGPTGVSSAAAAQETTAPTPGDVALPQQELTQQVMFDILLGEIAGQRGRFDVSAPHYLQAALDTNDPRVAERAVQIATFSKEYKIALRAGRHWLMLDNTSLEARKVVTALALKLDDTDEVVTQLDYIITHSKDPHEGFHLATAILARHANKQVSLEVMEQLASRYPDNAEAWLGVSRMAILADELERALEAADQALRIQPDLYQAEVLRAQILIKQDKKEQALQALENAVGQQPDNADLRFAYGRLLLDSGDLEGARAQFQEVVGLEPGNADALFSLALLELETQQLKAAERHLKQLLEMGEKEQAVYYYLGYTAQERGDDEAAIEWYGKVEAGDYWTQSRLRMSNIMVKQGRLDDVRQEMQTLRRNNPENAVDFYLIEGQVLSDLVLYDDAYKLYTEALEHHPDNGDLLYARSLVAEKTDRIDLAEQDMRRILADDPDDARALNALGYTLADRTERYDEALVYIEKAYAHKPEDPAIIDSMGWVHYRLGNLDKAQEYLQQAYDMTGDSEIGAHLGEVMWMRGEHADARRVWQESLEKSPDNAVLKKVIKRFTP